MKTNRRRKPPQLLQRSADADKKPGAFRRRAGLFFIGILKGPAYHYYEYMKKYIKRVEMEKIISAP